MAGQGSINPYQAPSPAIAGIAAALQAVQSYYGIDTAKAQQKLLGVQTEAEQGKVDEAKKLSSELDAVQSGGQPGVRAAKELGLSYVPATGGKKAVVPTADQPVSPLSAAIQGVNAGEAAGTGSSPLAVNNMTASDAPQSALGGSIKTISQATRPQSGASSRKATEVDASGTPLYARGTVTDANGNVQGYWVDNKQQAADLANQKTRGEIAKNAEELREMPQKQKTEAVTAFNTEAKPFKDAISAATTIQKGILSGNKISENLGQMKTALEVLGVKRAGGGILDATGSSDTVQKVANYINKASTGHMDPTELDELNKSLGNFILANQDNLQQVAAEHGGRAEAILGIPAQKAISKLFLPTGLGPKPIETSIALDPETGERVIVRTDKGKPQVLKPDQAGPKWTPAQKTAIATGSALIDFIGGIAGRASRILGGGGE